MMTTTLAQPATSTLTIHSVYRVSGHYFRQKRMRWLEQTFGECITVLDLGGHPGFWEQSDWHPPCLCLLNLRRSGLIFSGSTLSRMTEIYGDALDVLAPDQSYDLAMSNSVIEHVADPEQFARETLRVGKRVYCQTPSKWFPVEPHYLGLFVHWLPRRWLTHFVHRYFTLHGWMTKPDAIASARFKATIHLLSKSELRRIFPGCRIETERVLGIPKSYVVWR